MTEPAGFEPILPPNGAPRYTGEYAMPQGRNGTSDVGGAFDNRAVPFDTGSADFTDGNMYNTGEAVMKR